MVLVHFGVNDGRAFFLLVPAPVDPGLISILAVGVLVSFGVVPVALDLAASGICDAACHVPLFPAASADLSHESLDLVADSLCVVEGSGVGLVPG